MLGSVAMFSYGYSLEAPMYALNELHLLPADYGIYNSFNMLGMLLGGFLSAYLMKKIGPKNLLILSILLVLPCLISLSLISLIQSHFILWFFITTAFSYLAFGLIFPAASYFATESICDKESASSIMSFLNMASATVGVMLMGYLPFLSIFSLFLVLSIFFIVIAIACFWRFSQMNLKLWI